MFALKAVTRLASTSSQLSLSRSTALRHLATEPTRDAPDSHELQSKERQRSIRKVSEEGGAHSQLVALAVKNTAARANNARAGQAPASKEDRLAQAKRQFERRKAQSASEGRETLVSSAGRPRSQPARGGDARPRGGAAGASADAVSLLRGNARERPFNPRFPNASGDRGPRPPRRNGPPSSGGPNAANAKKSPRGAKPARKAAAGAGAKSVFSAEDLKPLVPPAEVAYPSINLAQLLRADLAAKALQVKRSVDTATVESHLDENSQDPKVREQARKILNGDYSHWSSSRDGKDGTRGTDAVEHATDLLARNPTIGLKGRQAFINKLKEHL